MQAIITSFAPMPDQRPAIVAQWAQKKAVTPYEKSLSLDDNHAVAAVRLARQLGWRRDLAFAQLPTGDYCHVPLDERKIVSDDPADLGTASPPEYIRGRDGHLYHRRAYADQ